MLGTFFRLAALTRDTSLIRSCVRLASEVLAVRPRR
jgi:hypothetical protein